MALHGAGGPGSVVPSRGGGTAPIRGSQAGYAMEDDDDESLAKRLELRDGEDFEAIPAPLLRKYVPQSPPALAVSVAYLCVSWTVRSH